MINYIVPKENCTDEIRITNCENGSFELEQNNNVIKLNKKQAFLLIRYLVNRTISFEG